MEDKHLQINLKDDEQKIMLDYDIILRVNDNGTKYSSFDLFDYKNQKYLSTFRIKINNIQSDTKRKIQKGYGEYE